MKNRWAIVAGLAAGVLAGVGQAELFVSPKPGQSQEAFEKDQFDCHNWAKQQTGFDPAQPPQTAAAPPPQQGGAVRGAARGAAVGRMRQNQNNRAAAEASQQAQSQQQANYDRYERAYAACLQGRGYSVK